MKSAVILFSVTTIVLAAAWCVSAGENSGQQAKSFSKTISRKVKLNYLLFTPQGYAKSKSRWPLILFLHGAGETGSNLNLVKKHGPPKIVATKKDFPFVVVSPQSPKFGWDVDALDALLEHVLATYKVDPDRVYLTGLSMGGYGTWEFAARYPHRFAAIVPICGGGSPVFARRLRRLPIWVFHGEKDTAVPISESERMVKAVKRRRGNVKFTRYPNAGHDSWTETYDNPKLYEWLLQHKRKSARFEGTWKSADGTHNGELLCRAVQVDKTRWQATFEGFCQRQFIYRVQMSGKSTGKRIHFQGTANLGEKDGGVYRWTGDISGNVFTGEYTSERGKKGGFQMKRVVQ